MKDSVPRHEQIVRAALCFLLFALTLVLYAPARNFEFIPTWDDALYVTENPLVLSGFHLRSVVHAFTARFEANWVPLALISHMLDVQLFGLDPAGHHTTNIVIHSLNAALLFALLARLTGRRWPSLVVAALFAVHPLQVESVVWVAERKNVLCTLLALCCIWAYAFYVRRPSVVRYLWVALLLACGLMAKPMLVTLPGLLLLLDFWPLGRFVPPHWLRRASATSEHEVRASSWRDLVRLCLEKVPLLGLSVGSSMMTYLAQVRAGTVADVTALPLFERAANAVISCLRYLYLMLMPSDLSMLYSHPYRPASGGVPPTSSELAAALALVLGITALVLLSRRGYLLFGWFWYLVALIPVAGIVQVGMQGIADRYTYIPLIGIFVCIAWGGADLLEAVEAGRPRAWLRALCATTVVLWLCMLATLTRAQEQVWRNSRSLFEYNVQITPRHAQLQTFLAQELERAGELEEAARHFYLAVQLEPGSAQAHSRLAHALRRMGRPQQAIEHYRRALALQSGHNDLRVNLGNALVSVGQFDEGIALLRESVARDQRSAALAYNLATAQTQAGQWKEAFASYERALALQPELSAALYNWGNALAMSGDLPGAERKFEALLERDPKHLGASKALERTRQLLMARREQGDAVRASPTPSSP